MSRDPSTQDSPADAVHDALLLRLTPEERLRRAVALSEGVRALVLAGAMDVAGAGDVRAVRQRFLTQVYGTATAAWYASRGGR